MRSENDDDHVRRTQHTPIVMLEWDRDPGATQIVLADHCDASLLVFPVLGANAGDAFRHPFVYAP